MEMFQFYVKDKSSGNLVAEQYLYDNNGNPVTDPNISIAKNIGIYDSSGILLPTQNVNGYLIVLADYTVQNAINFAQSVAGQLLFTPITEEGPSGLLMALGMMTAAFIEYGSQDLQRTYDGLTSNSSATFVSAFTDAASFNLGLVSAVLQRLEVFAQRPMPCRPSPVEAVRLVRGVAQGPRPRPKAQGQSPQGVARVLMSAS
jgi:hypothetical protein